MKKVLDNKKVLIIFGVIILLIGLFLCYLLFFKDDKDVVNNLKVTYARGSNVELEDGDFPFEKEITVENTTDDPITYSLEWNHVNNTFKDQNKLLYTIEGSGEYAADLGKSQIPVVGYKVYNSVVIMGHKTHTYKIKITYDGNDKDGLFEGTLYINSEAPKKSKKVKDKDLLKKQEEKIKARREEELKKNVKNKAEA